MIKLPFFAFAFIAGISIRAQTVTPAVISSQGGYSMGSSGSVAFTIGEPVSETYVKTSNITTMGFHQTDMDVISYIGEESADQSSFLVYPNPVRNELNLNFRGMQPGTYGISLYDAAGRLVLRTDARVEASASLHGLQLNTLADGNYMLNISGPKISSSIKLNKITN